MKKFAILKDNKLEYAPVNFTTPSGSLIVNFNKNETLVKKYGFKEVIDVKPTYNELTEYLIISGYTELETSIIINYTVKQMDLIDTEESIEAKVAELKVIDTDHEKAIVELYEMIGEMLNA